MANSYLSLVPINPISVIKIFMYFIKRAASAISVHFYPIGAPCKRIFLVFRVVWTKFLIITVNNLKFRLILKREKKKLCRNVSITKEIYVIEIEVIELYKSLDICGDMYNISNRIAFFLQQIRRAALLNCLVKKE